MQLFEDHKSVVYALAFSPDGTSHATGAKDGTLWLRNIDGSAWPLLERGPKSLPVHTIGYLPHDNGVVIGGEFGWLNYKHGTGEADGAWRQFGPRLILPVTSLGVLDEHTVAIGTGDRVKNGGGSLEVWDVANDRKLLPYHFEPNGVRAVAVCPKQKLVAWATGHRKVRVWNITTATKPVEFPQPGNCPAVALSADGTAMAVAVDWTAKIYDLQSKRERAVLKGHKGQVAAVAFSPDGSTVVTGSWDQTVRLWDAATGKERANYQWNIGRVYCVTYAPDGFRIAAGGDTGRVVIWDAE